MLEPLHRIAKALPLKLGVSQQNLLYYASLANFYTVHDLRNLKPEQTYLYLLCYAWQRYRQFTDNLVDAMAFSKCRVRGSCKLLKCSKIDRFSASMFLWACPKFLF